jgi:hypothetical protein
MSMTWLRAVDKIRSARNKAYGKPLQNNTRLYERGEGDEREFGVVLHGTEVVTIRPDDTYVLRAGGYHTVTTMDRIRGYSPAKLFSVKGEFYLWLKPVDRDPKPSRVERTIPKPYEAVNPGAEPIKSSEGCVAGQMVTTNHVNEIVELYRRDVKDHEVIEEVVSDGFTDDGRYDRVKVKRTWDSHVYIAENAGWDQGWADLFDNHSPHSNSFTNDDGEPVERVQCSHCAEFDATHERWRYAMEGERWGRRFDRFQGYRVYSEMMARFGTREAWHAAYLTDLRARRAYLKAEREWEERNRVAFYDGITVDSDGYAPRLREKGPSPAKLRRHETAVAKMKKRIDKYVDGFIEALRKGMPMPSGADCWHCALHDSDGKTWGDMGNHSHLVSHMSERYYVPTLAVNALRERGYKDVGIYMLLDMDPVRPSHGEEPARMIGTGKMGKPEGNYDGVKRDLVKYMRKRLVPTAPTA